MRVGLLHYPDDAASRTRRRTRYPEVVVRAIVIVAGAYTFYYLVWRLTALNPQALGISWVLWTAEAYGILAFALFSFMTWRLVQPETPEPPDGVSVDLFVPTRGEPLDILAATLAACARVRYPHCTYLLDDGGRHEVEALAARLGCHYIRRPSHEGAKAGNINHALRKTVGELVAILDADHIPLPGLLDDSIGHFRDRSVAVVQGPQLFYNLDSFQHENLAWHEQRLFYHVIQPGKNRNDSAFWCGSPSVLRRSAIEEIGGIAQDTVTEDLHTTLRLIKRGYRVVYTQRPLAVGLAPATIEDYLGQRSRWGQGAMQVLRSKDSPLWTPGLTLGQRLSFLGSTTTYFDGLCLLIFLGTPIFTLLTGQMPVGTVGLPFVARFVPYLALMMLANTLIGRGWYNLWHIERYSLLRAFTFASVLPTLLTGSARPFRVTSKEAGGGVGSSSLRLVFPHILTIALCIVAISVGLAHLRHPIWYQLQPYPLSVVIGWAAVNGLLLSVAVARLLTVSRRARYRFPTVSAVRWRTTPQFPWESGFSVDVSAGGVSFEHRGPLLRIGDRVEMLIRSAIPDLGPLADAYSPLPTQGCAEVHLSGRVAGGYRARLGGIQRVGVAIEGSMPTDIHVDYACLVHQPNNLLRSEQVTECGGGRTSEWRREIRNPLSRREWG